MGAKTIEQVRRNMVKFVTLDRESGLLVIDNNEFAAVEGKLLGFNQHTFDYKGTQQKKFDVFLSDDGVYQIQIGFYSWVNFRLLNQLINIENIKVGGIIEISTNMIDDNISVFVKWNGKSLKHKYKYADLKFNGKTDDEKIKHRNKIIDKWYAHIMELMPYDPKEAEVVTEPEEYSELNDDLPF